MKTQLVHYFIKKLVDRGVAATVLGNHDLNLLAVARGIKVLKDKDKIDDVIHALESDDPDRLVTQTTFMSISK